MRGDPLDLSLCAGMWCTHLTNEQMLSDLF